MERRRFAEAPCPIARSLDVLGDWWTPLIIRECLYGVHRFADLQGWLGISRNMLTRRLKQLVEQGVLERRPYSDRPPRFEYHLTDKGYAAATALMALIPFGECWQFAGEPAPIELVDRRTGERVEPRVVDARTGQPLDVRQLVAGPGPGFPGDEVDARQRFAAYFAAQAALAPDA